MEIDKRCSICNKSIDNEYWLFDGGDYFCSIECILEIMSEDDLQNYIDLGECYYESRDKDKTDK